MDSLRCRFLVVLSGLVLTVAGALVLYHRDPAVASSGLPPCTVKKLTGLDCGGCGMTRAGHELLHLRFVSAFRYNPLVVAALPFLLFWVGTEVAAWLWRERYRGPRVGLGKRGGLWMVAVILIYSVLRNVPYWPLTLLAPHGG